MAEDEDVKDPKEDEEENERTPNEFTMKGIEAMKPVTTNMKIYRQQANITQKQMAEKIGIAESYLQKIENGKCKLPAYVAYEYAQILELSMDELFENVEDDESEPIRKRIIKMLPHIPLELQTAILTIILTYRSKNQPPKKENSKKDNQQNNGRNRD